MSPPRRPWTALTATTLLLACAVYSATVMCIRVAKTYDGVLNLWMWSLWFGTLAFSVAAVMVWRRARGAAGFTWALVLSGLPWCVWLAWPESDGVWLAATITAGLALLGAAVLQLVPE